MVVLDSDVFSLLHREQSTARDILVPRLRALKREECGVTIVSFEEQTRGWLAYLNRSKSMEHLLVAYRRLHEILESFATFRVLDFDQKAAEFFLELRSNKIRVGTMDLRIAAVCLSNDAVLVTRNIKDFEKIPGLKCEDWTK